MSQRILETCFSPALFEVENHRDSLVVIIDVLRASSAICAAFENGAESIIPLAGVEEARVYKSKGYLVAAERDGFVLDFADFGNSPFNFRRELVEGKTIVYSTTNGTGLLNLASSSYLTIVGAFSNLDAVVSLLLNEKKNVLLFCAGWKNRFNLEDSVCAGAFAKKLMDSGSFSTICDSTHAAIDLWNLACKAPLKYIEKAAQRSRLRDKKLDDCLEFCMTLNTTEKVPVLKNGILIDKK